MSKDALKARIDKLKAFKMDALKARVDKLKAELEKKDKEKHYFLDRIEELEEIVMRLEALIPEEDGKKKSKKRQATDSKMAIELDGKKKKIRDLKNKMGILRKEKDKQIREIKRSMGYLREDKVQLQQELEKLRPSEPFGEFSRRNESALNFLVKDLQKKVNEQRQLIKKQEILINSLKSKIVGNEKFSEKLRENEE